MAAAELTTHVDDELERVELWRAEELERAGFGVKDAAALAQRHDVDLHHAVAIVERGCSPELAAQILL